MTDTITRLGEKAVIDEEGIVSGWLAPFGGPFAGKDLDGEYFSAKTDFALDYYPTIPVLFGHGRDEAIGHAKVGEITIKEIRDQGVWVEGHLDRQSQYYDAIRELADKGDMFWSSGALAHLVKRTAKTGEIKQWPIAEATLTLTPANPMAGATVKEPEGGNPASLLTIQVTREALAALKGHAVVMNDYRIEGSVVTPTFTEAPPAHVTITFSEPAAKDAAQALHDHALLLGAACPAGKEADPPPASVLPPGGNDVEPVSEADLATVKELMRTLAVEEIRRLTG